MKTNFLKMGMSMFVLMLAIVSAFAFKTVETKALFGPETGWINLPGTPCAISVPCDNTPSNFTCKAIHDEVERDAFGKNDPQLMICTKTLFRVN